MMKNMKNLNENADGRDIEKLLSKVKELENMIKELKDNENSQKDLLNITAHELRTPIHTIVGYMELIMESNKYREFDLQNGAYLSAIERNSIRLQTLINRILDLAKVESKSFVLNKVTVDLNQELKDMVEEFRKTLQGNWKEMAEGEISNDFKQVTDSHKIDHSSIEIIFEPSNDAVKVSIDRVKIYQVISNLLNNSLKSINKKYTTLQQVESTKEKDFMIISVELASSPFTPKFSSRRSIQHNKSIIGDKPAVVLNEIDSSNSNLQQKNNSKQSSPPKYAIVSIEDSGEGISNEIIPILFSKFGSNSSKGMGFGLYLSKRIVEVHGGKMWAQNKVQGNKTNHKKGAVFSFSLPVISR